MLISLSTFLAGYIYHTSFHDHPVMNSGTSGKLTGTGIHGARHPEYQKFRHVEKEEKIPE